MKKLVVTLALLPVLSFAKETTETLKISGWMCGGCPAKTAAALKKVPGVKDVKTDSKAETAKVTYDDAKATHADLTKAIASAGFEAK